MQGKNKTQIKLSIYTTTKLQVEIHLGNLLEIGQWA